MAQLRGLSVMALLAVAALLTACGSQSNTSGKLGRGLDSNRGTPAQRAWRRSPWHQRVPGPADSHERPTRTVFLAKT